MNKTPIEWTDFTVNPIRFRNLQTGKIGHHCVKISPGCANCYSSEMQKGPYLSGLVFIAENTPKGEFFLDEGALQQVLKRRKPCKIFWCDMTDMFGEWVPDEWIDRCFAVMALTPHLTHQVLTKRADRLQEYFTEDHGLDARRRVQNVLAPTGNRTSPEAARLFDNWPLSNTHLGVSVENQEYADARIPLLLQTPAAVRFVSYEPALGPVDFERLCGNTVNALDGIDFEIISGPQIAALDWVIVGGESGPGARPFRTEWAESVVTQCKSAGVACFVKQLGAFVIQGGERRIKKNKKGGDMHEWPHEIRVREFPTKETPNA